jgi:hypothetical protein
MRTLKKTARTAKVEGRSWKQNLFTFLRNYRATPHSVTHQAPPTLLFNRAINVKLPQSQPVAPADPNHQQALDASCKSRQKNKAKPSEFKVGDAVLLRNSKKGKLQTTYEYQKYQIVKKKGSMITASNDNRQVTRNSSHFKNFKEKKGETDNPGDKEEQPSTQNTNERPKRKTKPPAYFAYKQSDK